MERSAEDCSALKRKKSSLTLDLSNSRVGKKAAAVVLQGHGGRDPPSTLMSGDDESCVLGYQSSFDGFQLSRPDGGPRKLNAVELERFLVQPNGPFLASHTTAPLLLIKPTNEEQEAYARGFMDALMEIRKKQHIGGGFGGIVCLDGNIGNAGPSSFVTLTPVSPYTPINVEGIQTSLCPQLMPVNLTNSPLRTMAHPMLDSSERTTIEATSPAVVLSSLPPRPSSLNIEERTRQSMQNALLAVGNTPPQSPVVDMSDREHMKLERKREKNRRAAQKCRTRKLERIERLEIRTKKLRDKNERLASQASDVRQQVIRLKEQIVQHFQNGCFITETSSAVGLSKA